MIAAVDFETYYDKDYTVRTLGVYGYVKHPRFDPYMCSVVSTEGWEFVGNPADFDWGYLKDAQLVSHNKGFDASVYSEAVRRGYWSGPLDFKWDCSADMCVYLGIPNALAKAVKFLYGQELPKEIRNAMSGKEWGKLPKEKRDQLLEYCLNDSRWCLKIWQDWNHLWPDSERWLSEHTRKMSVRGVPVNAGKLESGIRQLRGKVHESLITIPWTESSEDTPLSTQKFSEWCRSIHVVPPGSMAMNNVECDNWITYHKTAAPKAVEVLLAMRQYRRCNMLLEKLEAMHTRMKPDGFMAYGLKYGGAHTLRDSGDGGVNMQNLPSDELFGVNLRGMIEAPPGFVFISSDLSQIEPRVVRWLIRDERTLEYLRSGMDPYEAYARAVIGYNDPRPLKDVDPRLRWLCKQAELSLCYGVGASRLQAAANAGGVEMSHAKAQMEVSKYRASNPGILALWNRLLSDMKSSHGGDYHITLPSGRKLHYWSVECNGRDVKAAVPKWASLQETNFFGGKLLENVVQAAARDVFMNCVQLIEGRYQLPVLLRVHDEVLTLAPESQAEEHRRIVEWCMSSPPSWAPDLPVHAEAKIMKVYEK